MRMMLVLMLVLAVGGAGVWCVLVCRAQNPVLVRPSSANAVPEMIYHAFAECKVRRRRRRRRTAAALPCPPRPRPRSLLLHPAQG